MNPEIIKFLVIQGISLGGVLILVGLAWLIGFRTRARVLDEWHVQKLAADDRVGQTGAIAIDALGRAALAEIEPDKVFVVKALGELPRESTNPRYDPAKVPDHSCKFILRGVRKVIPAEHVRIYEKIGRAYGFSVENAYVEDARTGRGFFLAIVLYTNPDGVLNDDQYAYAELADPFLDGVGEVVARAVFGS